ncbi:MAG: anti-sigma factor [Thermomicrobiales bacterium]
MEPADRPDHHDHAYYEGLVSAVALGTIAPNEYADLMAYLDTEHGASLRDDLAEFLEVAAALALSADLPDIAPSPHLRDRLHAAILSEKETTQPSIAERASDDVITPPSRRGPNRLGRRPAMPIGGDRTIFTAAPEDIVPIAPPVPIEHHSGFTRHRPVMRAVAALVIVAVLAAAVFTGYQLAPRNEPTPDPRVDIALSFATPLSSEVSATLRYDPDTRLLVLSTTNMPAAPADHVYQVWLIDTNGPVSAGTMGPDGYATFLSPGEYQTLAITVEPGPNGSPGPTTDPIVTASLLALPSS